MLTKTKAIVLHTLKYGDKKIFVDMFSREYGMITFSSSMSMKSKGRNKSNYFQPLNLLEVEFDMKPMASIHTIKDMRIAYPMSTIPFDPYKISISMFLAEFLKHALAGEQKSTSLYDYIENSIEWLDTTKGQFANFHIVFMIRLSRFIGFYPNTDNYYPGCWFDLRAGSFSPLVPNHKQVLRPVDATLVPILTRLNYNTMHLLRISHNERNECVERILEYYKLHIPDFPDLKSVGVLRELFS